MNNPNGINNIDFSINDVNFITEDGKELPYKEFIKKNQDIAFLEKLNVGDIVILKGMFNLVRVEHVDYLALGKYKVDYAGKEIGTASDDLILFNQKDIQGRYDDLTQSHSL